MEGAKAAGAPSCPGSRTCAEPDGQYLPVAPGVGWRRGERSRSADGYLHLSVLPERLKAQCGAGAGPVKIASPH